MGLGGDLAVKLLVRFRPRLGLGGDLAVKLLVRFCPRLGLGGIRRPPVACLAIVTRLPRVGFGRQLAIELGVHFFRCDGIAVDCVFDLRKVGGCGVMFHSVS